MIFFNLRIFIHPEMMVCFMNVCTLWNMNLYFEVFNMLTLQIELRVKLTFKKYLVISITTTKSSLWQ